ncbi:MAG TPA: glycosyltransferase, partial [archaeon]|nr:glycosyltransferase [archaeon]
MSVAGLKIGIFTETYRPQINGVVTSIENLKKILVERGAQPIVFTVGSESGVEKEDSVTVHRFKSLAYPFYPEYRFAPSRFRKVKKIIEQYSLDILHSHGPFSMGINALYAHKNLKIPLVGTFHTLLPEYIHYLVGEKSAEHFSLFLKRYSWRYLKWYYSRCDVITCPSKAAADLLKQKSFENVVIISNGIDTDRFNPKVSGSEFREAYGLTENEKIILALGRISAEKNIPFIVESASIIVKKNRNVKIVVAGEGPAKDELISLVNKMNLNGNFVFTGQLPNNLLPST